MADVFDIALVTFMSIAAFQVKNPLFETSDTIGISIERENLVTGKDTDSVESLELHRRRICFPCAILEAKFICYVSQDRNQML